MSSKNILATAAVAAAATVSQPVQAQETTHYRVEQVAEKVITRTAFDIGSGDARMVVANVDVSTDTIKEVLAKKAIIVGLKKNSNDEGYISSEGCDKLVSTLKGMQEEAITLGSEQMVAVGTSIFRTAKNGQELVERVKNELGIEIGVLPQADEDRIGFVTAKAVSGLNEENLVAWDCGSGSFQISSLENGEMVVYGPEYSLVPALKDLAELRNIPFDKKASPNPITQKEADQLRDIMLPKLPKDNEWIKQTKKEIVGIGRLNPFSIAERVIGHSPYTQEEVEAALGQLIGMDDKALQESHYGFYDAKEASESVIALIILNTVMKHCEIKKITFSESTGGCEGLLISSHLWPK